MPGTTVGSRNAIGKKTKPTKPLPRRSEILEWETDNKQVVDESVICHVVTHVRKKHKAG
jgi:hypothetical protein